MTMVSPQEIIDCNGEGSCQGGTVENVLSYAHTHGLVEEGCNVYRATNGGIFPWFGISILNFSKIEIPSSPDSEIITYQTLECNPFHRCGSCWPDNCFSLTNYTRYYVKEYGPVRISL